MAPALLICCKDYRFIQAIQRFMRRRGVRWYDLKATAGGVRALLDAPPIVRAWILHDVRLIYRLHRIRRILIVQHADCAAYGGSRRFASAEAEAAFQAAQLRRARTRLRAAFPGVRVELWFARRHRDRVRLRAVPADAGSRMRR